MKAKTRKGDPATPRHTFRNMGKMKADIADLPPNHRARRMYDNSPERYRGQTEPAPDHVHKARTA